jgi:uncharacterized membrane protein
MSLDYNVAGLLCYIPCCIGLIFSIIFVATEPRESRFVRFHSIQGLLLVGVGLVWTILYYILVFAVAAAPGVPSAGGFGLLGLLSMLVGLGLLVLHIVGMVKAYGNQMWKIPGLGNIAESNS